MAGKEKKIEEQPGEEKVVIANKETAEVPLASGSGEDAPKAIKEPETVTYDTGVPGVDTGKPLANKFFKKK